MAEQDTPWEGIRAKRGDRILPRWNALVGKAESLRVVFGTGTKVRYIPGGGMAVTGDPQSKKLRHPWKMGSVNYDNIAYMRVGTVDGQVPFVTRDHRLGEENDDGDIAGVQLFPKEEGASYVALGVNVRNSESDRAEIDKESTADQLRITQIDELPAGLGSGGVLEDAEGWAWYPLVHLEWREKLLTATFQVVYHNLGHFVVDSSEGLGRHRHFFPIV